MEFSKNPIWISLDIYGNAYLDLVQIDRKIPVIFHGGMVEQVIKGRKKVEGWTCFKLKGNVKQTETDDTVLVRGSETLISSWVAVITLNNLSCDLFSSEKYSFKAYETKKREICFSLGTIEKLLDTHLTSTLKEWTRCKMKGNREG